MNQLIEKLLENKTVVTDGSWGTQMQARGLKRGENPDSWCLTKPDMVEDVARQYVNAGSHIILTNSFGANPFVLGAFGLEDKFEAINTAAVELSKKAAGDKARVFASIGPSGKMLLMGEVTEDQWREAYEKQAKAQASAGADGIVVETMMDLGEAKIAVKAAKDTGLPVVGSMVFDAGKEKDRTQMGNTPEELVEAFAALGVDAVGANCGQGPDGFIPICRRMRAVTDLPIWMKPNAGLPDIIDGQVVYNTTAADFVKLVPELIDAGANFIGGCCGTDGSYISAIREYLDGLR